jgi:exonuclease SbcD
MAHAFVVGGRESESERKLTVGGTGSVSSGLFKDFGYVALGHLHTPHELGDGRLVYSGTPMPYSFSEEPKKDEDKKSVRVINVERDSLTSIAVPCTNFRDVVTLEGSLEDIMSAAKYSKYEDFFVRVRLTDAGRQIGVMDRLRRRFPHTLEVIPRQSDQQKLLDSVRLKEMARGGEEEVVREYISETFTQGLDDFQESLINEALAVVPNGDAS